MSKLNKSTVGLGKVINRLQTDGNDYQILVTRLKALERTNFIEGDWETILSNYKVSLIEPKLYSIDLDNNLGVSIIVNDSGNKIRLKGGLNGTPFYFIFKNIGDNIVYWDNVRSMDAELPYLSEGSPSQVSITTLTVVKVGNEYYITDVNTDMS